MARANYTKALTQLADDLADHPSEFLRTAAANLRANLGLEDGESDDAQGNDDDGENGS